MHGLQVRQHPAGCLASADRFAELPQYIFTRSGIGCEVRRGHHRRSLVVETVVAHEAVVEVERYGEALRHHARREAQAAQRGDVGRLHAHTGSVRKAELAQRSNGRDAEVPLRSERFVRAQLGEVAVHLLNGCFAQLVAVGADAVVDVLAEQADDLGVLSCSFDECIRHAILHRSQVHMRQRRLANAGDDPAHA